MKFMSCILIMSSNIIHVILFLGALRHHNTCLAPISISDDVRLFANFLKSFVKIIYIFQL